MYKIIGVSLFIGAMVACVLMTTLLLAYILYRKKQAKWYDVKLINNYERVFKNSF